MRLGLLGAPPCPAVTTGPVRTLLPPLLHSDCFTTQMLDNPDRSATFTDCARLSRLRASSARAAARRQQSQRCAHGLCLPIHTDRLQHSIVVPRMMMDQAAHHSSLLSHSSLIAHLSSPTRHSNRLSSSQHTLCSTSSHLIPPCCLSFTSSSHHTSSQPTLSPPLRSTNMSLISLLHSRRHRASLRSFVSSLVLLILLTVLSVSLVGHRGQAIAASDHDG